MEDWEFTPTRSGMVCGRLNGKDMRCGWYTRTRKNIRCVVLALEDFVYITLQDASSDFGSNFIHSATYGREIEIDGENNILTESIL